MDDFSWEVDHVRKQDLVFLRLNSPDDEDEFTLSLQLNAETAMQISVRLAHAAMDALPDEDN